MALTNLRETITDNRLRIPIGDHEYTIDTVSAQNWLWLQEVFSGLSGAMAEKFADMPEVDMHKKMLGTAYEQMMSNGVTLDELRIAGMTAIIDALEGRQVAEKYWETGGNPGNPQALMTEEQIQGALATPAPAAPSTPRRASRSGATAKTRAAKAGPTSSNTGS